MVGRDPLRERHTRQAVDSIVGVTDMYDDSALRH